MRDDEDGARRRFYGRTVKLEGLVQHDHPLTIGALLRRMRTINGAAECVTVGPDGTITRTDYRTIGARADRVGHALRALGVTEGERVATLMWNRQEHLELYMGVPASGAVLHTLNLRLSGDELAYIGTHADDRVVIVEDTLIPLALEFADRLPAVRQWIVVGDGDASGLPGEVLRYEELLAAQPAEPFAWPDLDDRAAAALCYTSGTTGNPKGVLYSHRSTMIHALGACGADSLAICAADRALVVVPMFHANAWGLPFAAALAGADLVMPGRAVDPVSVAKLIESERVTFACAVPTIWHDLLRYADEQRPDLSSLRMVACGGAALPKSLAQRLEVEHNVRIVQVWGMTETSPIGTIARPPADAEGDEHWDYRVRAGKIVPFVEVRLVDDEGAEVPWDGESTGEVQVRGPWIASAYFEQPDAADRFDDGWLRTGDVASLTADGWLRITDRSKDVIKSGGEWISSVEVENELVAHPDVREAAVVAMPDERWTERPLACVVLEQGVGEDAEAVSDWLRERMPRWVTPDAYAFIAEMPKTSTGKLDKKQLRQQLAGGGLSPRSVPAARR